MIIPALIAIPLAPIYLLSSDFTLIWWGFVLQGAAAAGGMQGQMATFMNERFPTEVRATASGFCYHQGAIWGGLVAPIIAYFATTWHLGYAIPMMIGTMVFALSYIAGAAGRAGDEGQGARSGSGRSPRRGWGVLAGIDAGEHPGASSCDHSEQVGAYPRNLSAVSVLPQDCPAA